jgi:hypothetical protein
MPSLHTIKNHNLGFKIVKISTDEVIPLFCEVCTFVMLGELDIRYYRRFKCCSECGMKWADLNQERWADGWRPTREEVKKEFDRRVFHSVSFSL